MPDRKRCPDDLPLVSVALTTYNGSRYLEPLLASLFAQDYPRLEIVVGDDASSDGSWEILERYRDVPGFRRFRNGSNLGYVKNFEKVLGQCRGDYIALADQDDLWLPHKVSRLVAVARDSGAYLVFSDAAVIDGAGRLLHGGLEIANGINFTGGSYQSFYLFNCVTGCTAFLDRTLLDYALPFPDGVIVHDWWLAFVACRLGKLTFTRERLLHYRIHGHNQIGLSGRRWLANLAGFSWSLLFPWRILREKRAFMIWQDRYARYFRACRDFERRHDLDSRTTERMIDWVDHLGHFFHTKAYAGFFLRNREIFTIIPRRLRPFAYLSRIISRRDFDLLWLLVILLYACLALYGVHLLSASARV